MRGILKSYHLSHRGIHVRGAPRLHVCKNLHQPTPHGMALCVNGANVPKRLHVGGAPMRSPRRMWAFGVGNSKSVSISLINPLCNALYALWLRDLPWPYLIPLAHTSSHVVGHLMRN